MFYWMEVFMGLSYKWNSTEASGNEEEQDLTLVRPSWSLKHAREPLSLSSLSQKRQYGLCRDFSCSICLWHREKFGAFRRVLTRFCRAPNNTPPNPLCPPSRNTNWERDTYLCSEERRETDVGPSMHEATGVIRCQQPQWLMFGQWMVFHSRGFNWRKYCIQSRLGSFYWTIIFLNRLSQSHLLEAASIFCQ